MPRDFEDMKLKPQPPVAVEMLMLLRMFIIFSQLFMQCTPVICWSHAKVSTLHSEAMSFGCSWAPSFVERPSQEKRMGVKVLNTLQEAYSIL